MTSFIFNNRVAHFYDSTLIVDGEVLGEFKGIKEAKEYLEAIKMSEELQSELPQKEVKDITEAMISLALHENGELSATQSTVAGLKTIIEEKQFIPLNTVLDFRSFYEDHEFNNKIEYIMRDGSIILIDIETNRRLNTFMDIKESADLLIYMTENAANFMRSVSDLLEDN